MSSAETLAEIIDGFMNPCPSGTALVFDYMESHKTLSYSDLAKKIQEIGAEVTEYACEGDHIALDAQNSMEIICMLFALLKIKVVCCPLNLDGDEKKIYDCMQAIGVKSVIVSGRIQRDRVLTNLKGKLDFTCHHLKCFKSLVFIEIHSKSTVPCIHRQDIGFVLTSSGSTGQQKVIRVPGKCILPNIIDLQ